MIQQRTDIPNSLTNSSQANSRGFQQDDSIFSRPFGEGLAPEMHSETTAEREEQEEEVKFNGEDVTSQLHCGPFAQAQDSEDQTLSQSTK